MPSEQLQIPRKDLSKFLPDLRTIVAFEQIMNRVGDTIPTDITSLENDVSILQGLLTYCVADVAIAKGTPVYVTGANSTEKLIRCAPTPIGLLDTDRFIGVASNGALAGADILIATAGEVQDIDTSGTPVGEVWTTGDALYYNPAYVGKLTNVAPSPPNQRTRIATVTSASVSGSLNVHVVSAIVSSQLLTNNSPTAGQGLSYTAGGSMEWNNNQIYGMSSGVITGGVLSINTDTTKFDISDGFGYVVDPETSVYSKVTWSGLTAIVPTYIAIGNISFIAIDDSGSVIQQATPFTGDQDRDLINLGVIVHTDNININAVNNEQHVVASPSNQLEDLLMAIGLFNRTGNIFTANGVNVQIDRSAGQLFGSGINYANSRKQPHVVDITSATIQPFQYRLYDGTNYTGLAQTSILPDLYDDLTSVPAAVPNNKFTNQHIFMFPTGNVKIQFGQNVYPTLSAAAAGVSTESFLTEQSIVDNGVLRAILTVKKGCTDLSNAAEARFFMVDKFSASIQTQSAALTSFDDSVFEIYDDVNPLKTLKFQVSGITSGATRTLTAPDFDGTISTLAGTETLTNKTITAPVISTISNTGTLTLPTSTDTLVGKATTDTLTNKTLTAPVISTISNTGTLTLPTATDTLVGKATTDTFTNKTFDTAGAGNVFRINGTGITAKTGTGSVVLANTPTLVTPNIGAATGTSLNVTGSLTCSQTTGLTGTTTNNNASAGYVGEFPSPTNLTGVGLTSSTPTNLSSISLTAGDYEVSGVIRFEQAATTTATTLAVGISTTSATFGAYGTYVQHTSAFPAAADQTVQSPITRISLAATTTVYLIGYMTFTTSTCSASGFLHVRRVR